MIIIKSNNIDISNLIDWRSVQVEQILSSEIDTAKFVVKKFGNKSYIPKIGDEIGVFIDSVKQFGGYVVTIDEEALNPIGDVFYTVEATDYSNRFNEILASKNYQNQTGLQIISDLMTTYCPTFTVSNVIAPFSVAGVTFNNVSISQALKTLATQYNYEWFVDKNKDLHFFPKFTNMAPFNLTDISGNYIADTLKRKIDGTQIINQVIVRGGEGDGTTFTDIMTVNGSVSTSFVLPYQFSNLQIWVDSGSGFVSKTVGQSFKDAATSFDCLYSYNDSTLTFSAALTDSSKIKFSGNPKVPIMSIKTNSGSVAAYGIKQKIIIDSNITDITMARSRAAAELDSNSVQSEEVEFETYTPGLQEGMIINVQSDKRGFSTKYIIKKITFEARTAKDFKYKVQLITTQKYTLNELLQSIIVPDSNALNASVIAETILTDMSDIDIIEIIKNVSPNKDIVFINRQEIINKDPLGPGVEPTWVLGPYAPTSSSDQNRPGRLDISMKLY